MGIFKLPHIRPQTGALGGCTDQIEPYDGIKEAVGCCVGTGRWCLGWGVGLLAEEVGGGILTCQDMSRTGEPPSPRPCSHLLALTNRNTDSGQPPPPVTLSLKLGTSRVPPFIHPTLFHLLYFCYTPHSPSIQLAWGYLYFAFFNISLLSISRFFSCLQYKNNNKCSLLITN